MSYETVIGTAGNDSEGGKRRFESIFFDWKSSTRNIDINDDEMIKYRH